MDTGKKRTANFSLLETDLLISLVKKYRSVVECLETDTIKARMKRDVWIKIQNEYNSQSIENPRTATILKNKYNNIKQNVKKQYAGEKVFHRGTGGGPTRSFTSSSQAMEVGEMLQVKMTGEPSVFDSDNNCYPMSEDEIIEREKDENKNIDVITIDFGDVYDNTSVENQSSDPVHEIPSTPCSTKRDWTNYIPTDLKSRSTLTANSDGHVTKRHKVYQDKITNWASSRASLSEQQQAAFNEQHKLKMILMREKHDTEIKFMTEKHHIEMENLQLQKEILELKKIKEKF